MLIYPVIKNCLARYPNPFSHFYLKVEMLFCIKMFLFSIRFFLTSIKIFNGMVIIKKRALKDIQGGHTLLQPSDKFAIA